MADEALCADCGLTFKDSRSLRIHQTKKHGAADAPDPTSRAVVDDPEDLDTKISKLKISAAPKLIFDRAARKYSDPRIALQADDLEDIDAAAKDLFASLPAEKAKRWIKWLPYMNILLNVLPKLIDRLFLISEDQKKANADARTRARPVGPQPPKTNEETALKPVDLTPEEHLFLNPPEAKHGVPVQA